MADPLPNEDPDVTFDAAAFEKMSSAQIADLLNSMIAAFEVRLAKLEQPPVGAEHQQVDINTDDTIDMQQIGNKFNIAVDLDQVRQQGGAFGAGGGNAVSGWTFDAQTGMGCLLLNNCNWPYAIITRYRLVPPSTTEIVSVRIEVANCPYVPCAPSPSPPPYEGASADIWRICGIDPELPYPQPGDVLLPPEVLLLGLETFDEPVIQLVTNGPCRQFISTTTGEFTEIDATILEGCDNEGCDNCFCEATCIRITDANGDWIELTVDAEGQSLCDYTSFSVTRDGPNGGLDDVSVEWIDDAWVISVTGPSNGWSGVYAGPQSGCPTGTITKTSGTVASPATLTITECAPVGCPEDPPENLRIVGYTPTFFGQIKFAGGCGGGGYAPDPINEWDGTFAFYQGDCVWWPIDVVSIITPLYYASNDPIAGRAHLLNENTNFTSLELLGGEWKITIGITHPSTTGRIVYKKATGVQPMGVYTIDLTETSAAFQDPACYEAMPETLTIEDY